MIVSCAAKSSAAQPAKDSLDRDYAGELPRIPPTEPANALTTFHVAPGFGVEQVAAEPLVDPAGAIYNHRHPAGGFLPGAASSTGAAWVADQPGDLALGVRRELAHVVGGLDLLLEVGDLALRGEDGPVALASVSEKLPATARLEALPFPSGPFLDEERRVRKPKLLGAVSRTPPRDDRAQRPPDGGARPFQGESPE